MKSAGARKGELLVDYMIIDVVLAEDKGKALRHEGVGRRVDSRWASGKVEVVVESPSKQ